MKTKKLLLLGCGDLGAGLGLKMAADGYQVDAVRRNRSLIPSRFAGHGFDYGDPQQQNRLRELAGTYNVMTPVPAAYNEAGYQRGYVAAVSNLLAAWQQLPEQQLLFVSSTRVYGDYGGDWVDEQSELKISGYAAEAINAAEQLLLKSHHRVTIIRFAGIYGRLPSRLLDRVAGGAVNTDVASGYSNRIHRDDCVGFLAHLLYLAATGHTLADCYLGVDDLPCRQQEVESWLAAEMKVSPLTQPAQTMRTGNKRCANKLLRASGYQLQYPDFRSGYTEVLRARATPP